MTKAENLSQDALAAHSGPEPFHVFAEPEISAHPYWIVGECFYPNCARDFQPKRDWQKYCSRKCADADLAEKRRWSLKGSDSMLAWGMFEKHTEGSELDLYRAGRRHLMQNMRSWVASRKARRALARQRCAA